MSSRVSTAGSAKSRASTIRQNRNRKTGSYCYTCFKGLLAAIVVVFATALLVIVAVSFYGWGLISAAEKEHGGGGGVLKWFQSFTMMPNDLDWGESFFSSVESESISDFNLTTAFSFYNNNISTIIPKALTDARLLLDNHPFHRLPLNNSADKMPLEDAMFYLSSQPQCKNVPIFTSMAQVGSDLYWQLIQNFVYTMVKFRLSDCSVMICVTDQFCMDMCKKSGFPCLYYDHGHFNPDVPLPSALEQIAQLKLLHLPKALKLGVNILMMDLDVGFLQHPMKLIQGFYSKKTPSWKVDIMVQRDISFVMHRSVELWRTWYTEPLPNIGLLLIRASPKTVSMFEMAWSDYKTIKGNVKHNPGKDQNKVVQAMKSIRGLHWAYFKTDSAVLLDKLYKFEDKTFELGGIASFNIFNDRDTIAVHTTCYEQKSKVMGLKAANAFWNPEYYDPSRRTLTKKIIYHNYLQFSNELKSLIYLSIVTGRTLIIPNILGPDNIKGVDIFNDRVLWPGFRAIHISQNKNKRGKTKNGIQISLVQDSEEGDDPVVDAKITNHFHNEFNVLEIIQKKKKIQKDCQGIDLPSLLTTVEPAYYWRVKRDYSDYVPNPTVIAFFKSSDLTDIESHLLSLEITDIPRIILHMDRGSRPRQNNFKNQKKLNKQENYLKKKNENDNENTTIDEVIRRNNQVVRNLHNITAGRLHNWATDSVGLYKTFIKEKIDYIPLPKLLFERTRSREKNMLRDVIIGDVRPCRRILEPNRGNRSCFDKCS